MGSINHGEIVESGLGAMKQKSKSSDLGVFQHFPQPVFLLNREMDLIDTNVEGALAIDKHWVSVAGDKVHFNSHKSTAYVKQIMDKMANGVAGAERFILPCIDMVYRAYTLSYAPSSDAEFLLYIQDDNAVSNDSRMTALAKAFSLTKSEVNVLTHMVEGRKPKEIAYETDISLATVRSHLRTLYAKMNVRSYNDALKEAIRLLI